MTSAPEKLAALGGEPVCRVEWPAWPVWDEKEEASVLAAVRSGRWGICPDPNPVSEFACRFAGEHQAKYALCCCNGTIAIIRKRNPTRRPFLDFISLRLGMAS